MYIGGAPRSDVDTVDIWGVSVGPYKPSFVVPLWCQPGATAAVADSCVLFRHIPELPTVVSTIASALAMVLLLPGSPIFAMLQLLLLLLLSGRPALAMLLLLKLLLLLGSPFSDSTSPGCTPASRKMSGDWDSPVWTRPTAASRDPNMNRATCFCRLAY